MRLEDDLMIFVIPENLMEEGIASEKIRYITYQEMLETKFKKDDILVSNLNEVMKYSNLNGLIGIFVLEDGYYSSSKNEQFKFFTTRINLKPLCDALAKKNLSEFVVEERTAIINIIFNKNFKKTLLLERKKPFWGCEPVKGGVEDGESLDDAVSRETREECGIESLNILYRAPKTIVYDNINIEAGKIRHVVAHVFASVADDSSKTNINEEDAKKAFSTTLWVATEKADSKFVLPRYKIAFEYALNGIKDGLNYK